MKKHLLTALTFGLTGVCAMAQITIDENDFPSGSDTAMISVADITNIDLTETGADFIWDFSDLHIASQRIDTFFSMTTASFGYQYQFNNLLTEPDYVSDYYYDLIGFDLAGADAIGVTVEKPVGFARITSTSFQNVGIGLKLNGFEVPMAADTVDTEYELPMTYLDAWASDSYTYVDMNPAFDAIFQRYQYRTSEVDGWGTITTRFGTFDVIRVRSEIVYSDSAYLDFGFGGPQWVPLPTPTEAVYTWWSEGNKVPVMKIVAQVVGGNETITRIEFKDKYRNVVGIEESENLAGELYPNPANQIVYLSTDPEVTRVEILDIAGNQIYNSEVTDASMQIDVANWAAGFYIVNFYSNQAMSSAKLIIE